MNVLEKILEEIENESQLAHEEMRRCVRGNPLQFDEVKGYARAMEYVVDTIRSHMDDIPNCGDCSRRKWYQKGFEDGKKDKDWISAEDRLPEDGVKHFSTENIQSQMRAAKLSNRMLTTGKSILRAIRDETTGEYAWFDNKYLKMFDGCTPNLIKHPGNSEYYNAVFTRYGEIIGIILPVSVSEW